MSSTPTSASPCGSPASQVQQLQVHRLSYGPEPEQYGDLWLPAGQGPFPIVVNLHGGYWRERFAMAREDARLKSLVEKYAQSYKTMTDKVAKELVDEWFDVQTDQLKLQRSYLPEFRKALPDVKVMRYYQLERKIDTVLRYELGSMIPLVQK